MKTKIGRISAAVLQKVGNKSLGEGVAFSSGLCPMESAEKYLHRLIDKSFNYDDIKRFDAIESLDLNPVYRFVSHIFDAADSIVLQSNNLARFLYEQSIHPRIKSGDFYVIYFEDCEFDGTTVDAVGLFKSESVETVLKIYLDSNSLRIIPEHGMGLRKLDKGCIIFNLEKENGYKVVTVDNSSGSTDAHYWTDNFLHVVDCRDNFHQTIMVADMYKEFVQHVIGEGDNVAGARIAKKASLILSEQKTINPSDFADGLDISEEQRKQFLKVRDKYESEFGLLSTDFTPDAKAMKKRQVSRLNTIRLGHDFEVKIMNPDASIESGFDKGKNKHYIKLLY